MNKTVLVNGKVADTREAGYVWLPIQFNKDIPYLVWMDEWKLEIIRKAEREGMVGIMGKKFSHHKPQIIEREKEIWRNFKWPPAPGNGAVKNDGTLPVTQNIKSWLSMVWVPEKQ